MPATPAAFATIGRSFSCEAFALLYEASLAARARRRALGRNPDQELPRRWFGSGEPVTLPLRLPG